MGEKATCVLIPVMSIRVPVHQGVASYDVCPRTVSLFSAVLRYILETYYLNHFFFFFNNTSWIHLFPPNCDSVSPDARSRLYHYHGYQNPWDQKEATPPWLGLTDQKAETGTGRVRRWGPRSRDRDQRSHQKKARVKTSLGSISVEHGERCACIIRIITHLI